MNILLALLFLFQNVPAAPRHTPLVTGSVTSNTSALVVNTTGFNIASVTIHGTYSGVNETFEFSDDGVQYYPTTCTRTDNAVQETNSGVLIDNTVRAWDCSVYGSTQFRARATAYSSGTGIVGITLVDTPIEAAPTVTIGSTSNVIGHVISDFGSQVTPSQRLLLPCNALRKSTCQ